MKPLDNTTPASQTRPDADEGVSAMARGAGIAFFAVAGNVVVMYVYSLVIARYMGSRDYGNFFLGITVFNLACLFCLGGVEDAMMRFVGIYARAGREQAAHAVVRVSFLIAVCAGMVMGLACFFTKELLAQNLFHKPGLAGILFWLCLAVPVFSVMTICVAAIRSYKIVFPYVFIRKIFFPVSGLVLGGVALALGYGVKGLSLSYLSSTVVAAIIALVWIQKNEKTRPRSFESPLVWHGKAAFFKFLAAAYLSNFLVFLFSWSDILVLGVLGTSEQLGIYFAAKRTALAIGILLISLNMILGPMISHLHSGGKIDQLSHVFKTGTLWILVPALPVFLMLLFFPGQVLSLFGPGFKTGGACLMVLASGQFVNLSVGSVGYMLLMTGHQKMMVYNSLGAVCFSIILMVFFVPRYGIMGAAVSTGVSMALANLTALLQVYLLLGIHPYSRRYVKIIGLACVTGVLTWGLKSFAGQALSGPAVVGQIGFIYGVFFLLFLGFGLTPYEKMQIKDIRNRPLPVLVKGILGASHDI